jgi:cystine transport system substrate-binding protein
VTSFSRFGRCVLAFLAPFASACSPAAAQSDTKLAALRASGTMRVGITETSPPWTYLGDDNKPAGYDVAVAKEVGRRISIPNVVFVVDNFRNFMEGLKADKYDFVFNDLAPTAERQRVVDFTEIYGVEDYRIVVRTGLNAIKGLEDLKGRTIGVTTATANEVWARANLPDTTIKGYDNGSFVFQDIGNGRVDATIISHFGGVHYAQATNLSVEEVGPPLVFMPFAAALRKSEPSLKTAADDAIRAMAADGTLDTISRQFLKGIDYAMTEGIVRAKRQAAQAAQ